MQFKCIKTVNPNHCLVLFKPWIGSLSGATTPSQSGPGSDGNEGVLRIPQSSSIAGTSPSDCLASYQDTRWEGLIPLQRSRQYILQPQLTGQVCVWCVCGSSSSSSSSNSISSIKSDGNEGVLRIPQSSIIAGTLPSDCLASYQDTRWEGLILLQRSSRYILQPQPTGQVCVCGVSICVL